MTHKFAPNLQAYIRAHKIQECNDKELKRKQAFNLTYLIASTTLDNLVK